MRALRSGVGLGFTASAIATFVILTRLGGWQYYQTPIAVRGYEAAHAALRPSGPIGQSLGMLGALLMLVPFLYMLRKRMRTWTWAGSMKSWLEVHLFCGILAPVLITFHTSFKFNGIVSAAYWSMVVVVLSGFVGRYLYVRIPRTLRGSEMSRAELDAHADELRRQLAATPGADRWMARLDDLERPGKQSVAGLLSAEMGLRLKLRQLRKALAASDLGRAEGNALLRLTTERAFLLRRIAYLEHTKSAFALWHVFHVPFVYILLVIVCLHVGVTLYLGYIPFRW